MSVVQANSSNGLTDCSLRLQPWLDALTQAKLRVTLPVLSSVSDRDKIWLVLTVPCTDENSEAAWMMLTEAMELLGLLARAHHKVAWYFIAKLIPTQPRISAQYREIHVQPRFKLTLGSNELFKHGEATFKGLMRLAIKRKAHSPTYDDVKAWLVAKVVRHCGAYALRDRVEVSLTLDLESSRNEDNNEQLVERLRRLLFSHMFCVDPDDTSKDSRALPRETSAFQIPMLEFRGPAYVPTSTAMLSFVHSISKAGVRIAGISLAKLYMAHLDETVLHDFLTSQLATPRKPPIVFSRLEGRGVPRLKLDMCEFDKPSVAAVCFAIAHSKSLREFAFEQDVSIGDDESDVGYDLWWRWLAYALFSPMASHGIHSAELNMEMLYDPSLVEGMRTVVNHEDPLAYLHMYQQQDEDEFSDDEVDEPDVVSTAKTALLMPSAVVHRGGHDVFGPIQADPITFEPVLAYHVIYDDPDEDFVEVLIPQWGVCWTDRSHVLEMNPVTRRETHSIRHLTLKHFGEDSVEPAVALLKLVGSPVEHLTIRGLEWTGNGHNLLDVIVKHCPNLKRLDLRECEIESLQPICDRLVGLKTLYLAQVTVRQTETWMTLLTALSNPLHPLMLSLRELHIALHDYHRLQSDWVVDENIHVWSLKMLAKNLHLLKFEIARSERGMAVKFKEKFAAHHDQPLLGKLGPLRRAETLAFLSVVTLDSSIPTSSKRIKTEAGAQGEGGDSARYKMDFGVLQLILHFAARPPRRFCCLSGKPPPAQAVREIQQAVANET